MDDTDAEIDRVAEAVMRRMQLDLGLLPPEWEVLSPAHKAAWRAVARAAIGAMQRKPLP